MGTPLGDFLAAATATASHWCGAALVLGPRAWRIGCCHTLRPQTPLWLCRHSRGLLAASAGHGHGIIIVLLPRLQPHSASTDAALQRRNALDLFFLFFM